MTRQYSFTGPALLPAHPRPLDPPVDREAGRLLDPLDDDRVPGLAVPSNLTCRGREGYPNATVTRTEGRAGRAAV